MVTTETVPTEETTPTRQIPVRKARKKVWREAQAWTKWMHTYTSMIALLLVLFFGITGVTLNHPDWTFGFDPNTTETVGVLPDGWLGADDAPEFLVVSEFLRDLGVKGQVSDYGVTGGEGFISYRGPGYSADVFIDLDTGTYELSVEQQGWIAVLNDLHKGRDTNSSWKWLIDVSGIILIAIAATGLALQLFLRRRRTSALIVAGAGVLITLVFTVGTLS